MSNANESLVCGPRAQPNDGSLVVREYLLAPRDKWQVVGIHDGWVPLCVRSLEHALYLCVLVDTSIREEAEIFHLVRPGDNLRALAQGKELAFLGQTYDERYLFLEVNLGEDVLDQPVVRRVTRDDIPESG